MSEQDQEKSIIGGINRFLSAKDDSGVEDANNQLSTMVEQQEQAHEGLDQIDENVAHAEKAVKDANKAKWAQRRSAANEIVSSLCAAPFQIVKAISNVGEAYPKTAVVAVLATVVGINNVDKEDISALTESFKGISPVSTSSNATNTNVANDLTQTLRVASFPQDEAYKAVIEEKRLNSTRKCDDLYFEARESGVYITATFEDAKNCGILDGQEPGKTYVATYQSLASYAQTDGIRLQTN